MKVDLKWILALSMFLAVLGFLGGAGSQFTDLGLAPATTKAIIAIFVILLGCGNAVNSVLIAFGMTNANRISSAEQVPLGQRLDALVANNPEVKGVVTTAAIADATESEKITSK